GGAGPEASSRSRENAPLPTWSYSRPLPTAATRAPTMPSTETTITTTASPLSTSLTVFPMWRRLRRRSLAPSRPALFPDQVGLAVLSLAVIVGGIYVVVRVVFG